MRSSSRLAAVLLVAACTARDEPVILGGDVSRTVDCDVGAYLQQRRAANFCDEDDDCVEIVPEQCLAPYYANAASAAASLRGVERELADRCGVITSPACMRLPLGVPRCRRHRCVAGELDREARKRCWPSRVPLLELGQSAVIYSRPEAPPVWNVSRSAHVRLDEPAILTLHIEPHGCVLSRIDLRLDPSWLREFAATDGAMTLTQELEAGEYLVLARNAGPSCPVELTAELHRTDGTAVPPKYHGLKYLIVCD
ncbi:hypothetical protein OV079_30775 [Nannocystis pusilla]|uniref:Uncharacterized protein n=1 Tax=Nannocystis pusilla TaxID=889268 RepID=A0A9X3J0Q3_9BACT|nr:hypothetical protein [Nannocystis pusilla]MCY1009869.1 hypothetical protein [Nannocystis pusilla]